jgi:hypothetical protein
MNACHHLNSREVFQNITVRTSETPFLDTARTFGQRTVMAVEVGCKGTREVVKAAGKETNEVERGATGELMGGACNSSAFQNFSCDQL